MTLKWLLNLGRSHRRVSRARQLPRLAVVGSMRSGTNLVRQLVEKHWAVSADFSPYGWKHAGVPILSPDSDLRYPHVPILFVVKNPYATILSLFRYRMLSLNMRTKVSIDGGATLEQFLVQPVSLFDSQLPGSPQLRFANPVQYWNFIYYNLETLSLDKFSVQRIKYEDLLVDPEKLRVVEQLTRAHRREQKIVLPSWPTRRETGSSISRSTAGEHYFDTSYYSAQRYLEELTSAQISFIGEQADPWLMERLRYSRY